MAPQNHLEKLRDLNERSRQKQHQLLQLQEDGFIWLEEVLAEARKTMASLRPKLLPQTPHVKRTRRKRQIEPVEEEEDSEAENVPPPRKRLSSVAQLQQQLKPSSDVVSSQQGRSRRAASRAAQAKITQNIQDLNDLATKKRRPSHTEVTAGSLRGGTRNTKQRQAKAKSNGKEELKDSSTANAESQECDTSCVSEVSQEDKEETEQGKCKDNRTNSEGKGKSGVLEEDRRKNKSDKEVVGDNIGSSEICILSLCPVKKRCNKASSVSVSEADDKGKKEVNKTFMISPNVVNTVTDEPMDTSVCSEIPVKIAESTAAKEVRVGGRYGERNAVTSSEAGHRNSDTTSKHTRSEDEGKQNRKVASEKETDSVSIVAGGHIRIEECRVPCTQERTDLKDTEGNQSGEKTEAGLEITENGRSETEAMLKKPNTLAPPLLQKSSGAASPSRGFLKHISQNNMHKTSPVFVPKPVFSPYKRSSVRLKVKAYEMKISGVIIEAVEEKAEIPEKKIIEVPKVQDVIEEKEAPKRVTRQSTAQRGLTRASLRASARKSRSHTDELARASLAKAKRISIMKAQKALMANATNLEKKDEAVLVACVTPVNSTVRRSARKGPVIRKDSGVKNLTPVNKALDQKTVRPWKFQNKALDKAVSTGKTHLPNSSGSNSSGSQGFKRFISRSKLGLNTSLNSSITKTRTGTPGHSHIISSVSGITTFLPRQPPKPTLAEIQEKKEEEIKKKIDKEQEVIKKRNQLIQQNAEKQRKKREERMKRVLETRQAREREALEQKKKLEKEWEERLLYQQKQKEQKQKEEEKKKQMAIQKKVEVEERKRQEEAARLAKLAEQEEEGRRQEDLMMKKKEYEELERQQKILEKQKMLVDRVTEHCQAVEAERLRERQRQQEQEEKRLKEEQEEKKKREAERIAREKIELERLREREQQAREKMERERQEHKQRLQEEKQRKEEREQVIQANNEKIKADKLQKQPLNKTVVMENSSQPPKTNLNTTVTLNDTAEDESQSYQMTPGPEQRPKIPITTLESYNIHELSSEDSTDDDAAPKKAIPSWAQGNQLRCALINQEINPPDIYAIFQSISVPDLGEMFKKHRSRFFKRTSSAVWDTPPGCKTK